jgi:Ca2+-binding RTX toxin-like protein
MRLSIFLAIFVTIALASAPPASAGSVCNVAGVATFAAADVASACPGGTNGASELNALTVSTDAAGDIVFTDANNPITDADGPGRCSVSANTGTCPGALAFDFDLGAGGDSASVGAVASGGNLSTGGDGSDHLVGGPFGDLLDGGPGDDALEGGAGDDTLHGGTGSDSLDGGAGSDVIHGGDGVDHLTGGPGADLLFGGGGDDIESGGADNDSLDGGPVPGCVESGGGDELNGDGGDDSLCGGAGPASGNDSDALRGGDGEDHAWYLRAANVSISLDNAVGDGESGEADNVGADVEDVTTGSGSDVLVGSNSRNVLDGGPGPDVLSGAGGDDVLMDPGGDGAADRLDGGDGDDAMAAGAGPDIYIGGAGEDAVTDYASRTFSVHVTLDGIADDGTTGEGDNIGADVEDVTGGVADDTLVGNSADNELVGGAGDDSIAGGDGNDGLSGGAGRDTIEGGAGRDDLEGGAGADALRTRDGATDRATCGGGTDSVQGEARDDIAGNCENVNIAPPTQVGIGRVQVTRAGFVVVRVSCPAVERSCSGIVTVKTLRRVARRFIQLGRVSYRLRGGQGRVIRAKIGAKDRRPLKRAKRVKVRAIVTNVNSDTGASTNATKVATVNTRGL